MDHAAASAKLDTAQKELAKASNSNGGTTTHESSHKAAVDGAALAYTSAHEGRQSRRARGATKALERHQEVQKALDEHLEQVRQPKADLQAHFSEHNRQLDDVNSDSGTLHEQVLAEFQRVASPPALSLEDSASSGAGSQLPQTGQGAPTLAPAPTTTPTATAQVDLSTFVTRVRYTTADVPDFKAAYIPQEQADLAHLQARTAVWGQDSSLPIRFADLL